MRVLLSGTNDCVAGDIFWEAFLSFCKQHQDRVYLVTQGLGLARGQLRFLAGSGVRRMELRAWEKGKSKRV